MTKMEMQEEIIRLRNIIKDMQKARTTLQILHNDGTLEEITVFYVSEIPAKDGGFVYYETPNHLHGHGIKVNKNDIKGWEVKGFIHGGAQLLKL